jgi:hypothetical protein
MVNSFLSISFLLFDQLKHNGSVLVPISLDILSEFLFCLPLSSGNTNKQLLQLVGNQGEMHKLEVFIVKACRAVAQLGRASEPA